MMHHEVLETFFEKIIISSDSASTIAIAKENLTRLANYRRISMQENVTPNDNSISVFLGLVSSFILKCTAVNVLMVFLFFFH